MNVMQLQILFAKQNIASTFKKQRTLVCILSTPTGQDSGSNVRNRGPIIYQHFHRVDNDFRSSGQLQDTQELGAPCTNAPRCARTNNQSTASWISR